MGLELMHLFVALVLFHNLVSDGFRIGRFDHVMTFVLLDLNLVIIIKIGFMVNIFLS